MDNKNLNTEALLQKIVQLEEQLFEANAFMDAIRDGSIDAFVLNKKGQSNLYALESIDYTYRILIEKFSEGAITISNDGFILYCNSYFAELLQIPITKITGSDFHDLVTEPDHFRSLLDKLQAGPSKGEIMLKATKRQIPVYISLTSLAPNIPAIGMIVTDLSQNKAHEREILEYQKKLEMKIHELDRTNRDLEQFVHIISHDIKEPLRKIISYGDQLKRDLSAGANEKNTKNLNIICDASSRLNLLVDDLAQYSFSLRDQSVFKELDLNAILKDVLNDIDMLVTEKKAEISFDELPWICGSEVQMRQLFSNLIINAIKYSRKNVTPYVRITLEAPVNGYYKINVADNGIGIEEQYLQKIFTIFQRLHSQNEYSGTGIGLAICKKIVENHKGKISVQSTVNKGSIFSLYLPVISPS